MEECIVTQSVTNTSPKLKSFEELSQLYENINFESRAKNADSKIFLYTPVIQYVSEMLNEAENNNSDENLRLLMIKTCICYDEAKHLIVHGNVPSSLEALNASLNILEDKKLHPHITFLYFRILNQLACFQAKNNMLNEAKTLLENAEALYEKIEKPSDILVYSIEDLFNDSYVKKNDKLIKFEKLITNNLQIQGWIYNKMKKNSKFIIYQHRILRRQLETEDGNIISWVFKCARLGSYFFGCYKFREARYQLAAAYHVLREYELDLLKYRTEPHFITEWSNLQKYYADLGKYWIKYGMFLFEASRINFPSANISDANISELLNSFKTSHKTFNTMDRQNFELSEEKYGAENSINLNDLQNVDSMELLPKTEGGEEKCCDKDEKLIQAKDDEQNETMVSEVTEATNLIMEDVTEQKEVKSKQPIIEELVQNPTTEEVLKTDEDMNEVEINVDNTNETEIKTTYVCKEETQKESMKTEDSSETHEPPGADEIVDYKFIFPSLNLTDFESKVNVDLVQSTIEARALFQFTQDWIQRCKDFYTSQNAPLQYMNLILDLNELYRYLSKFETTLDDQYDVQKRRVHLLEAFTIIIKEFQPQYYLSLNIELLNELTEAQIELLAINIRKLNHAQSLPLAEVLGKREQSIRKMEALIDIRKRLGPIDSNHVGPRVSIFDLKQLGLA